MSQVIQNFRAEHPQYDDIADDQLVTALHGKYYSDMPFEDFTQKIGYQQPQTSLSVDEQPSMVAQPQSIQQPVQDQSYDAMTGSTMPYEKPMLDLIGEKLTNMGAGLGERAGDLGGELLGAIKTIGAGLEEKAPMGGFVWEDGDVLPSYKTPEEFAKTEAPMILDKGSKVLKNIDLGYEPQATWEGVKTAFSEGGPLSGSAYAEVLEYGLEQGVKSIPDMAAAIYSLPTYILARSGEIGEERAKNKGKENAELEDVLEAAPFAAASALLERIGAKGITSAGKEELGKEMLKRGIKESSKRVVKAGGKALSKEAATEAIQEGMIEYVGEKYGTKAEMDFAEALDRAAAGAVAGGVFGGVGGTGIAAANEISYSPEKALAKSLEQDIEGKQATGTDQEAAGALSPDRAQLESTRDYEKPEVDMTEEPLPETQASFEVTPESDQAAVIEEGQAENPQKGKIKGLEVVEAPIDEVTLSEDVPQFKEGAGKEGVVEPLGGKFERTGVAPIQVWVREDGRKEVISGRHRLDLAKRSGETTIPAQYHYESEGFGADKAAALDAILNIREGQGKVKDYVDFIQATKLTEKEANAQGILARATGKRAFTIADSGSDTLIASHRANQLSDEAATRIAKAAPKNDALQAVGIKAIQDGKPIHMAENLVKAVASMTTDTQQASEDLFGFDDSAMKEAVELARKASKKQAEIQRTLTAVTGAAKNPALARKEGIDIKDPDAILKKVKFLKSKKKAWDNWHTNPQLMAQLKGKSDKKPDIELKQETEADIAKREKQQKESNQKEAEQQKAFDDKAQADKDADDFVLAGSELEADQAMARGQDSLFDAPVKAKPKPSLTKRDVLNLNYTNGIKEVAADLGLEIAKHENANSIRQKIIDKLGLEPKESAIDNDTRGKGQQYHGTSSEVTNLDDSFYSTLNIYGQGFYTTDAMDIAQGYSKKGGGKQPVIYTVNKKRDLKLYDMEQDITPEVSELLEEIDGDNYEQIINGVDNLREYYDERRVIDEFESADEIQGVFDSIASGLSGLGYDGLRHIGGIKTGKKAHNVEIIFKPTEVLSISRPSEKEIDTKPVASSKTEPVSKEAVKIDYSTNSIEAFKQFRELTGEAKATKADIKSSFDDLIKNKEAVLEQLGKLTKAQLLRYVGRNDLKKPQMVKSAYQTMVGAHVFGDATITIFGGSQTYEEQIADKVAKQTQEDIDTDYERQRVARAEREKQKEAFVKSMTNPESLADFKEFIRVQGKAKLTAEQLKTYDTLVADSMLESEKQKPKTVEGVTGEIKTERAQTVHSKKGHDVYVVSLVDRVSKEQYKELNDKSKSFGGYYSAYNKDGAIPGFQFKSIEDADQFEQVLKGKDINKSDRDEARADIKNASQADKLIEMADKLEAKGNESLGQDRQTNTGKRAAQAASASEKAYKQIATAQTVKQIAAKLAAGEVVYLGKMTQITQLEELKAIQRKAVPSSMMHSDYDGYSITNSIKEGVTLEDYINNVRMPELFIDKERAQRFSDKLDGVKGFSRFASELQKLPMAEGKVHLGRLTKEQVKKLHDAVKAGHLSSYELGFIPDREKTISRLDKMGITTEEQLRTAIRELDSLTVVAQKEDPIKKLERDLVGKKIDGYFPTPRNLVEQMMDYADIKPGHQVLEPSAGKGNIADIIKETEPNAEIDVIEINQGLRSMLEVKGYTVVSNDFMDYGGKKYDRIIMNPPFENFQDIDHVKHAYDLLKPGGKLVAIMGAGVKNSRKKAVEFRQWIDEAGSYIEDLPDGSFKTSERQTGVATVMVTIEKPDGNTLNRRVDTEQVDTIESLNAEIKRIPGVKTLHLFEDRNGRINLEVIIIDKDSRGSGVGSDVVTRITNFADSEGKQVVLTPALQDDFQGTTSRKRLIAFYKRFGFIENKGRNKDFAISAGMYRDAQKQVKKLNAKTPEIMHAPGHNYVGLYRSMGLPARREVVTVNGRSIKMPSEPQRIEPIMRDLIAIMGRRIYNGKVKGKGVGGFYRSDVGELRTARKNDVEVLAHEMAHYLDIYSNVTLPNFKQLYKMGIFRDEVAALSYTDDKRLELIEGFAEFVRLWLTNSQEAQLRAPGFYNAFNEKLSKDKKLNKKMRSLQANMHKYYFQGADHLGRALIGQDEGMYGKFMDWTYRRDSLIRQQSIDKMHAAREVEKELTDQVGTVQESAWKQFRIANGGYEGIAEYIMNYGTLEFAENGDLVPSGKGLYEILKPVDTIELGEKYKGEKPIELLMRYFAGRRALELHKQDRENLIPKETAKAWAKMGKDFPVFESIFKDYQQFNERMMNMFVDAGLLTPEARATMAKVNQDYVPFNRLRDTLEEGKGVGGGFHRLKGGTANLEDILANIQDGITSNVKAALESRAKQRLYQYIAGHRDGAIWATKIAPDSKLVKAHLEDMQAKIEDVLEASGVIIEGELDLSDPGLLNFWQHGVKPKLTESGNFVDTVLVNGKPQYYEVQDPLLQQMLLGMAPESYGSFMNTMFGVKNFFTRSITLGIEFTGANLVRDTIGATFISKNQFTPFLDSFKGMYSYLRKDKHFQDFMRSGGGYSSRLHGSTKAAKARQRIQIKEYGVGNRTQKILSKMDNIMSAFEYGTRIGEFRLAKKNMASDMDAAFAAREISTDFSVYGQNHFFTGYIRTIPFLNAMIQSQDRIFREAIIYKKYGGNPTALAMKAFLGLTVPTLLLWMLNKDDEDYKEIPDHEKRTNWHLPMGDGTFIKVPRPYDVGFVFATMPELFFKYMEDENGREYAEGMAWTMLQMYGVDGVPAAAQGWWDITRNKKWTGAPVVPAAMADVSASEQYNANTSETFVRLGQALGVSPMKAEHMFKAQTGYLGGYLLWGTDHMMWDEDKFGDKPERDASSNVFLRRFLTPQVRPNNRSMEKFFDLKEQSDRVTADFKAGIDIRRAIKGDIKGDFKKDSAFFGLTDEEKKVLFALNDSMNDLVKVIYGKEGMKTKELAIRYDKKLTGEQKREELDNLWTKRNAAFTQYYGQAKKALGKAQALSKKNEIEDLRMQVLNHTKKGN